MSTLKLSGLTSGSSIIKAPDSGSTGVTFTLPASAGTLATTADVPSSITDNGDATAITIDSNENVGIGHPLNTHTQKLVVKKNASATTPSSGAIVNLVNEQGAGNFASLRFTGTNQNAYLGYRDGTTSTDRRLSIGVGADSEHFSFTSNGLTFNGDTAAANALDDYEEGTYNAVISGGTSGTFNMDANDTLAYTKVGRIVSVQGYIGVSSGSVSGNLRMTLPFTPTSLPDDAQYNFSSLFIANTGNTNSGQKYLFLTGDAYGWFYKVEDNGTAGYMHNNDVDSAFQVGVSFTYISG